jgi:outer membrane protein insertion porin family
MKIKPFFIIMLGLTGCTALHYVPENEKLYRGSTVKVISNDKVTDRRKAVKEVNSLIRPKRNTTILGMRPRLWIYYAMGNSKKQKGIKSWIKKKLGEPPVYMSEVDAPLVSQAIDAKLYNMGFFNSYNSYQVVADSNKKTAGVTYTLFLSEPFMIDSIFYPQGKDDLSRNIRSSGKRRSLLKPGKRYDLDNLKNERARIEDYLKRHGFYYFNQQHILFVSDTAGKKNRVSITVTYKNETPYKARLIYRIGDVNIYPDYRTPKDSTNAEKTVIDSLNFFGHADYLKPKVIRRSILLRQGHIYDSRQQKRSLTRLSDLGVFKFTNLRIAEKDTVEGFLSVKIFLTPMPKRSLNFELQAVSKSNNFMGPGVVASVKNRNAFKGAELLITSVRGSFETQFSGQYKGKFTYEINPQIELYTPGFLAPFKIKSKSHYIPRTKFVLNYSYLSRVGYFDISSFKFATGYKWKQSGRLSHDLSVLNINYFRLLNTTTLFEEMMQKNLFLKRRFEEQYIVGSSYSFLYNEQVRVNKKNQFYLNVNAETAGNMLALFKRIADGVKVNSNDPSKILGVKFAQFIRLDFDARDYYHILNSVVASRIMAGWGLPYGNSSSMPYIKQYFSGGAYSLRGFQAYSVGPGTYRPPDSLRNTFFLQQGGEIKLEANLEYRFPVISVLKAALFTDIGNTWLNRKSEGTPGAQFNARTFYKELCMDVGTGIRVDLDIFVIRLDIGIPVRKAWLPEKDRWSWDEVDFSNKSWRKENLIFNIAFGYPF